MCCCLYLFIESLVDPPARSFPINYWFNWRARQCQSRSSYLLTSFIIKGHTIWRAAGLLRSRGTGKVLYRLQWELRATPSTVACCVCVYENYSRHFILDSLSLSNATGDSPSDSSRSSSASFVRISSGKSISASFQLFYYNPLLFHFTSFSCFHFNTPVFQW